MKLWKKLMPVATAAATVACVVPMASCSKTAFSTSDLSYKSEQVAATTTAIDANAMVKEYFKDSKHLAQDLGYTLMLSATAAKEELEEYYKNVKFEASVAIKDLKIGAEKEVTLPSNADTTIGYLVSGSIVMTNTISYDYKTLSEGVSSRHYEETSVGTYSMNDVLVYFTYDDTKTLGVYWSGSMYALKAASTNWSLSIVTSGTSTDTTTFTDGRTYVETNHPNDEQTAKYSDKLENYRLPIGVLAYSFDKVLGK